MRQQYQPRWVRIVGQRVDEDIQRRGRRRRIMRQTLTHTRRTVRLERQQMEEEEDDDDDRHDVF